MSSPPLRTAPLQRLRRSGNGWASLVLAAIFMLPLLGLIWTLVPGAGAPVLAGDGQGTLSHLMSTVLPEYARTSLWLLLMVAAGVFAVGIAAAWVVAVYAFPGKRFFEWALILPLAMPTYVMAYAYTDFLQFSGPVQSLLREWLGVPRLGWFPEIRSVGGAGFVFVFTLYPYVYLLTRTAFLERSPRLLDAARTLGCSSTSAFIRVALPLARPAAVAGVALVMMETLADYGAVSYFGVQTFTTGIYRAWLSMSDHAAAAQLALTLVLFVFALVWVEHRSRGRLRFYGTGQRFASAPVRQLRGWKALVAVSVCGVPLLLGFVLPVAIMLRLALQDVEAIDTARYLQWVFNTLRLAGLTALLAVVIAVWLAYAGRIAPGPLQRLANRIASLGYAVPGAVLAVGILMPLGRVDQWLNDAGLASGLVLTGSIGVLVYAYLVRFLSAGLQTVEAGLARITPSIDASARSLGAGRFELLWRIHAPLLRRSVLTAALLVFVDVMKELPATLVLRPFNTDTLAVIVHQLAADERLGEAAVPALTIVLAGLLPVIILARAMSRRH